MIVSSEEKSTVYETFDGMKTISPVKDRLLVLEPVTHRRSTVLRYVPCLQ
jgi:hypothetical protein